MIKIRLLFLLSLTLALSGCRLPVSSHPLFNIGSGLAVPGFTDGYYRYKDKTIKIETISDGEHKYTDGILTGTLITSPINRNVWMLQVDIVLENKRQYYYMIVRPDPSTSSYLISEITECSKRIETIFSGITGHLGKCMFSRPGMTSLTDALLQILPANTLEANLDSQKISDDVSVFRIKRIPDRAGQLIHRKIEIDQENAEKRRRESDKKLRSQ